jgi:guanylate kinase
MGKVPLLDVDIKGAINLLTNTELKNSNRIFILPPSIEILKQRLIDRGTENEQTLNLRFLNLL